MGYKVRLLRTYIPCGKSKDHYGEKMLVTDQFVFLHLPRAGGTFIYEVVKKFFPSAKEIGYHLPRALLPKKYSHLPLLGTVRNPWEFYVSWYQHQYSNVTYSLARNVLFGSLSHDRTLGFVETIKNALDLGVNNEKLDLLLNALPETFDYNNRNIPNVTRNLMEKIRGTGLGLYTFRFNHLFGESRDVFFCRVETLRTDLIAFFQKIGVETKALRNYVLSLDRKNVSDGLHYTTYYTRELADLISIRDRQLIERFGFTFSDKKEKSIAQIEQVARDEPRFVSNHSQLK